MRLQKHLVASLTILLAVSPQAFGGPTSVSGSVAYFSGDQSGGIRSGFDFSCPPIYTVNVYDLTTNIGTIADDFGIALVREAGDGAAGPESRNMFNARGGNGGAGGLGGEVIGSTLVGPTVNFTGGEFEIFSSGIVAGGIYARSEGGTGGAGGYANSGLASAWGGAGGYGGLGMPVTVTSNGGIHATGGFFALGIWAVSAGGTGGAGGATDAAIAATGGAGGAGGSGRPVTVHNDGHINTGGVFSAGILATSGGGNGGVGGSAHTGGNAYGGQGGAGGDGGTVIVTNDGSIQADGIFTFGVAAGSSGGTGGDGGSGVSVLSYGKGGDGGRGGAAGPVDIDNHGSITITSTMDGSQTQGFTAGILGQSLGGIGGNGGSGSSVVGVGGNALGGGSAGTVDIENTATITATGLATRGILAQSVGGFGGTGGSGSGVVGWGGSGTSSGNGVLVTVENSGAITATGAGSFSILAQSIGGGGGDAGYASGGVSVGGTGSAAGNGGTVTVTNTGALQTFGVDALGLAAQSIGGGGGSGGISTGLVALGGSGNSSGNGGVVTVINDGQITTTGHSSDSIFAQSLGGGGGILEGAGSINVDFFGSIGGSGGAGGSSSTVTVNNGGHLQTSGDDASGILAQSLGGGGGRSGWSFTGFATPVVEELTVSASEADIVAEAAGLPDWLDWLVGASGGGGDGGQVNVITGATATISTEGVGSYGIHAQSVGGGGGTGKIVESKQLFVGVAIGSNGGAGGNGGAVNVTSNSTITTQGNEAEGLFAQSIGGGGGNGGSVVSYTGGVDYTVNVALGGQGGDGGDGGTVNLTSNAQVTTLGENAHGLHGQSVGGGGGSGGNAVTWTANLGLGLTNMPTLTAGLTMGASGGSGGSADKVTILSTGDISTAALRSYGILAQSVGGGGGDGGSSMAGLLAFGTDIVANVALGGKAGVAGNGADVDVDSDGVIETQGDFSHGILAQSIGGGGGAGGNSSFLMAAIDVPTGISPEDLMPRAATITVGVGGASSAGGAGGLVDVDSTGAISTKGDFANGILAQSVGGGGGAAGNSTEETFGLSLNPLPSIGVEADVSVGGFAYTGGSSIPNNGGSVIVHNSGAIVTEGAFANGILAQSVGGGGGTGGDSTKMTTDLSADLVGELLAPTTASWDISVGGFGGKGGAGGGVTVDNSAGITTVGHFASGILAQSIGGGGGAGGERTKIATELSGVPSLGLLSAIDPSITLAVGGFGSNGGAGGGVDVSNGGAITTAGHFANGILAQSVGGGGGAGGSLMTLDITAIPDTSVDFDFSGGSFSLGGLGGLGGAGGVVTVTNSNGGDITTGGHFANGILAQSIGGGGGTNGSIATSSLVLAGGEQSSTLLKGASAGAGNGDAVTVENSADIVTHGGFAHGILAQSIGGGGGFGGISESGGTSELDLNLQATGVFVENAGFGTAFAGSAGGSGSAGAVSVTNTNTGAITTTGEMSHGIFAQSAAGTGAAGPVTVTLAGDIRAYGAKSHGIYAQSVGGGGNGNITINNGGIVQGGSADGAGVNIDGGANNTLTNAAGGSISALSGKAIVGGSGNETIHNYGTVAGTVESGGGTNAFHNYSGARFDSGLTIDLGAGGTLTNSGILSPGGLGNFANTTLTGDFVQLNSGILEIEIGGFTTGFFDSLSITGTLTSSAEATGLMSATSLLPAGGDVHFSFLPGYDIFADIDPGQSLALLFLSVEGNPEFLSTSLFSYEFFGGPAGFQFDVFQQGGGLYVQAENVVPVPGACLLGFLGLGVAGWKLRKTCA